MSSNRSSSFRDASGIPSPATLEAWKPLLITRQAIEDEIQRLAGLSLPVGASRSVDIVHPEATEPGLGVGPGLGISIHMLNPGEETTLPRDNASRVEFVIRGRGSAVVGDQCLSIDKWDAWNCPSMVTRTYRNDGPGLLAWLSYSNVPTLQKLGIHYSDDLPSRPPFSAPDDARASQFKRQSAPDHAILDRGARLRGYEFLTDIEVVESKALIWPWSEVKKHMSVEADDAKRTIMLLYNPATERRNGTTHSFFATISSFPAGAGRPVPARGHKHTSTACNYHLEGAGSSIVDGVHYDWEAGDLMLSAPAWSEHAHGTSTRGAKVLTIQDHPFQIGIESLIWQEKMDGPILTLGAEQGQTGYVGPRLQGAD